MKFAEMHFEKMMFAETHFDSAAIHFGKTGREKINELRISAAIEFGK